MLKKRSTILNMWTLLHWLSAVSRPSSGISRLASSTSGVSHGSLKSAVVLKSNDCLRKMGAVEHPSARTASAKSSRTRCMAGLHPATRASAWPDGADGARRLVGSERPTHLVAIERPGRARDGTYRNMRGADVSAWNARIDELFVRPGRVTTVGVGDGGNEIGMGNVRARLAKG